MPNLFAASTHPSRLIALYQRAALPLLLLMISLSPMLPITAAAPQQPPSIYTADDLLAALEQADEGLLTLRADIQYDRRLKLQGDRHVRRGVLLYRALPASGTGNPDSALPTRRAFAVDFNRLWVGERQQDDPEQWIFDGEWLIEKRPARRSFIKRRIARPDDGFDPLRIGQGPMPIPIGQRADDIRARYDVELVPADNLFDGQPQLARAVKDSKQLLLTPKPHLADNAEFTELRLWYRWDKTGRFLPRMSRTINHAGDVSFVQLINVRVNETLDEELFNVAEPSEDAGWDVQIIEDFKEDPALVDAVADQ